MSGEKPSVKPPALSEIIQGLHCDTAKVLTQYSVSEPDPVIRVMRMASEIADTRRMLLDLRKCTTRDAALDIIQAHRKAYNHG